MVLILISNNVNDLQLQLRSGIWKEEEQVEEEEEVAKASSPLLTLGQDQFSTSGF